MALTKKDIEKLEKENGLGRIYVKIFGRLDEVDKLDMWLCYTKNDLGKLRMEIDKACEPLVWELVDILDDWQFPDEYTFCDGRVQNIFFSVANWKVLKRKLDFLGVPWRFVDDKSAGRFDCDRLSADGKKIVGMDAYVSPVGWGKTIGVWLGKK